MFKQSPHNHQSSTTPESPLRRVSIAAPPSIESPPSGPSPPLNTQIYRASASTAEISPSSTSKMPQYTSRDVGDPSQIKKNKQSMADLKLRRLTELNNRLREDLERERIPVSQASKR